MNDQKKYVFVGNREYILKEIIRKGLNLVAVWVIEGSFLHTSLSFQNTIDFQIIKTKKQLIENIQKTEFDVLISNGCKYILPIKTLRKALYVNIHPSYLPDLRGKDPINGAVLFGRDCGATCHIMNDEIDTGDIISRERIKMTNDIDAALLFQLAFQAEVIAFKYAYDKNFVPLNLQTGIENLIYYSMQPNERLIDFNTDFDYILRQVKAFGYRSKGLYFRCNGENFRFSRASEITNTFVKCQIDDFIEKTVFITFEDSIVFKHNDRVMRFDGIENGSHKIENGDLLQNGDLHL